MKKTNPVVGYGLILISIAWVLAALIISIKYQQKSFLILAFLAVLALLCAVCGLILTSKLLPDSDPNLSDRSDADKQIARSIHLSGLFGYFIPLANVYFPYWLWQKYRTRSNFINNSGLQAVNFQLTCCVYFLSAFMLCPLLIGFVILPIIIVYHLFFMIQASFLSRRDEVYIYPGNLKFIVKS